MRVRNFRRVSDGAWLDVTMTTSGDGFSVPAESHVASAAAACRLDPADVEALESDIDQRTGSLVLSWPPPESDPEPDPDADLQQALADVTPLIDAVQDTATKAALTALQDALRGKGRPAKAAGRPV